MRKLEIGAGGRPTPGYEHLDIELGPDIEIVADARKLPIGNGVYDEVWSHWVLEHFAWREMVNLLKEWKRVLKPNGILRLATNNQEAHNKCLADEQITWKEWVRLTYGIREREGLEEGVTAECAVYECHKIGFTSELLGEFLERAGFVDIEIEAGWRCREVDGSIKCPGLVASARRPRE